MYSCPIAPGKCEGVRGDTSVYLSNETIANNDGEPLLTRDVLPQSFVEGRLFDQARESKCFIKYIIMYANVCVDIPIVQ